MAIELEKVAFQNDALAQNYFFDVLSIEDFFRTIHEHEIPPTNHHKVGFYLILVITEGQGVHTIDFKDYNYSRGTILTIRENQVHKFHVNEGVKGKMLIFKEDFLVSQFNQQTISETLQLFNELISNPSVQIVEQEIQEIESVISIMTSEHNAQQDQYAKGVIRSALYMIFSKIARHKATDPYNQKYLSDFITFQKLIEEHSFITRKAKDYAEMMHCSTKTLNNITRAILDISAKELIDSITTTRIKRILLEDGRQINEIAYEVGFDEPTNFYKYFKHQTGTTPEVFRKEFS